MVVQTNSPKGIFAVGIFLFFGAIMASLAGTTLVWRGTMLDRIWAFNLPAYRQLAPFGKMVGIPFLLLGATLAVAGVGWFKRRMWGWRLAVAIIATQVLGDLAYIRFPRSSERGPIEASLACLIRRETPRTGRWPYQSESVGCTNRLQRCDKEFDEIGGDGLKGSVVLLKTALFKKGLPVASFLAIAREFVR